MKLILKAWQTLERTRQIERKLLQPSSRSLNYQQPADANQDQIDISQEVLATQTMIYHSAYEDRHQRGRKRHQIIMRHCGNPQSGQPITRHSNDAGGQKISLQ